MQCEKCGNELSNETDEKLGLCKDCAYLQISAKKVIEEVNTSLDEDDVLYQTKYGVISALNFRDREIFCVKVNKRTSYQTKLRV